MPPTAGSSTAEQPRFYYDLASPEAYLVAERALHALGEVPEWIPVQVSEVGPFRCQAEIDSYREDVERRAAALGAMPLRWPDPFPADTRWAISPRCGPAGVAPLAGHLVRADVVDPGEHGDVVALA